jgi:hypothetical protein
MENNSLDAVNYAVTGNMVDFKSAIDEILVNKISDSLDVQKIEVARDMFEDVQLDEARIDGHTHILSVEGTALHPDHKYDRHSPSHEALSDHMKKHFPHLQHEVTSVGYDDASVVFHPHVKGKAVKEVAKHLAKHLRSKTSSAYKDEFGGTVSHWTDHAEEPGEPNQVKNYK